MEQPMKDSRIPWIGHIPKHWEVCRFKNTHNGTNVGENIDKQYWCDDTSRTPFYSAAKTQLYTIYENFPDEKFTTCDDILLARNGTPYVYLPIVSATYTDHIIRVTIKRLFNKFYIKYCIEQAIQSVAVNTVSLATWSASIWNEQKLPIPPLAEQEAIASYLDSKCKEIDELVALQERMIEELKAYRQSVITEAVTKGLNPNAPLKDSGIPWIGQIPQHWEVRRLKSIVDKRNETPTNTSKYIGLENVESFSGCFIETNSQYDISQSNSCLKGDVIFGKLRPYLAKSMVITEDCCCSTEFLVLKGFKNVKYLRHLLVSNWFIEIVNASTYGTKMPRANASFILNMQIVLPPLTEQEAIAGYLDTKCKEIDELISIKQKKIARLKEFKKSMIYEYVTGKKQVAIN